MQTNQSKDPLCPNDDFPLTMNKKSLLNLIQWIGSGRKKVLLPLPFEDVTYFWLKAIETYDESCCMLKNDIRHKL